MKIGKFFGIAFLILLAANVQPAMSAWWQWSKTAATNASADPSINWAEGQSPSSINDSARAMMARAAEWRDDISGAVTLGGTATAYTMATNQAAGGNGIASPPLNGQMLAFVPHVTNGISSKLAVDDGTPYPLQSSPGVSIASATIIAGTPYRVSFNLSSLAWVLEGGFGNPYNVPLGGILHSTVATAPNSNFVVAAGQCISATTYAVYWAAIGSPASGACAGGQFAVLDAKGRGLVGLDTMGGLTANRLTSSGVGCGTSMTTMGASCANGIQSQTLAPSQLPSITSSGTNSISVTSSLMLVDATGVLQDFNPVNASGFRTPNNTASLRQQTSTNSSQSIVVTSSGTTSTPHPTVDPNVAVYVYVRVI